MSALAPTAVVITPMSPPPVGYNPSVVMVGRYTDIVKIIAPDNASTGSIVPVDVRVKNIDTLFDHMVACVIIANGDRFVDAFTIIRSGKTFSFTGTFIMPNKDITIYAYTYYPLGPDWVLDDEATKDVDVAVAEWVLLATKSISIGDTTPPELEWVKLATTAVTITPKLEWIKLATKTVTVEPTVVGWTKLTTRVITVTPPELEWVKLATETVTLISNGVPPTPPPEEEKKFPWTWVLIGGGAVIAAIGIATAAKGKGVG